MTDVDSFSSFDSSSSVDSFDISWADASDSLYDLSFPQWDPSLHAW